LFYDINPLLCDYEAWNNTLDSLCDKIKDIKPDLLVAIESRGFLIAAALSLKLKIGFSLIRKQGKLPGEVISQPYSLEYNKDSLEIQVNSIKKNQKVLIIDDVLATGGTINASINLLSKLDANILGCLCLIELKKLNGRQNINIPCYSIIEY
jgi:adenine phosphoribosyltransferase